MLAALKNFPRLVDGLSGKQMIAGSWNASDAGDADSESAPQGDTMKHETNQPKDESLANTLAQMAQGLAQSYADRERPERTGRLHRV